jgi:beta-galactosidase
MRKTGFFYNVFLIVLLICGFVICTRATPVNKPAFTRERLSMNNDWDFKFGRPAERGFKVTGGTLTLPHDWAASLLPDYTGENWSDIKGNAFKPIGYNFPNTSIANYSRVFHIPESDAGRRFWIEFDGVFRESRIWVNGNYLGLHESGYDSFRFDITDLLEPGKSNNIVVQIDASQHEGWWYEGAGIYRNVWLVITDPLSVAPDGIFVSTQFGDNLPQDRADVKVETKIDNKYDKWCKVSVNQSVIGAQGRTLAETSDQLTIEALESGILKQGMTVKNPELWSPETPKLYTLVTRIFSNGELTDEVKTPFGFRTIQFDAEKGFMLNGKKYEIKGVCLHQDYPGVGTAMSRSLHAYRIRELKKFGCNAIRMSHNPADPLLMDLCDQMGMLVMAETRAWGSTTYAIDQLERLILRDRNHPSVFIWTLGNEKPDQSKPIGKRMGHTLVQLVNKLDPTRLTTFANNQSQIYEGVNSEVGVHGWNYGDFEKWKAYHEQHPEQPTIITEYFSGRGTRSIYFFDKNKLVDSPSDYRNSYRYFPSWYLLRKNPWLSGIFYWTGFDYGGEPGYRTDSKGPHNSYGILDRCGFWKDLTYYYATFWNEKPVLHLLPHWNWPDYLGKEVEVWAYTNAEEAELFLNDRSLGKKSNVLNDLNEQSNVMKWNVPYEAGRLVLKAYNKGMQIGEEVVETTGMPASVKLTLADQNVSADGDDIAIVNVAILDSKGRMVPFADNMIMLEVEGEGKLAGVGNGDPGYSESEQIGKIRAFGGLAQVLLRTTKTSGLIKLRAYSDNLIPAKIDIKTFQADIKREVSSLARDK